MCNLKDVREIIKGLDEITGLNGADLPIQQKNSKKVLGCFVHSVVRNGVTKQVIRRTPTRFEFSTVILNCSKQTLEQVVKHEYAHYMALVKYNDNCQHDWRFKQCCQIIGASADEPTFSNNEVDQQTLKMSKYVVTCQGCGAQFTYQRKCPTLTACQQNSAKCGCGCHQFTVVQNY